MTVNKRLSAADTVHIHDLMKNYVNPKGSDGFITYHKGWDDKRVLSEVKTQYPEMTVNLDHIKRLRQSVFGVLKRHWPDHRIANAARKAKAEKLTRMEARLAVAEEKIGFMNHRMTFLEDQLGVRPPPYAVPKKQGT